MMLSNEMRLPPLRQELKLEPAPAASGRPRWRLYDPFCQRFFILGEEDMALLSLWSAGTVGRLRAALKRIRKPLDEAQLEGLLHFLNQQHLLQIVDAEHFHRLRHERQREHGGLLGGHSWRSVRLPLLAAEPILDRCQPLIAALGHGYWLLIWVLLTLTGLYLTLQQWDQFVTTFGYFFSWSGILCYAVALVVLKFLHELGHAYVARHQGCRVGRIGVAIFMGLPMFYTELDEAVRIAPAQRKWIATGGVMVETLIAGICTLVWAVFPDGVLRSLAFVMATTSWVTTLVINLNPLARFDGYYFVSDLLAIENLQPRSLAVARAFFSRALLGPVVSMPEPLSFGQTLGYVIFGILVWCYQTLLVLGIAWGLYLLSFRLLGVALLAMAISVFVLRPIWRLLQQWWQLRKRISTWRRRILLLSTIALLLLVFAPLDRHVAVPAVMEFAQQHPVQVPEPGKIAHVHLHSGQSVRAGQVLLELTAPLLMEQIKEARSRYLLAVQRLDRVGGSNEERTQALVLERERAQAQADLAGLELRRNRLRVLAAQSGQLVDVPTNLQRGQWVSPRDTLGMILQGDARDVQALAPEQLLARLRTGAVGWFYPEDPSFGVRRVSLQQIGATAVEQINPVELSSIYGGSVASVRERARTHGGEIVVPVAAWHRLRLTVQNAPSALEVPPMRLRGQVRLNAEAQSLGEQVGGRIWRLLVQELRR